MQQVFGDNMFTPQTQIQFLGTMARSEEFFHYAQEIPVHVSDFTLPACQLVYEVMDNLYREYQHAPSLKTLELAVIEAAQTGQNVQTEIAPEEFDSLISVVGGLWANTGVDEDYMQDTLLRYVKDTRTKQVMTRYSDALVRGLGAQDMLKEMSQIQELKPARDDIKIGSMLGDSHEALIWSEEDIARIPTGISALDKAIMGGLSATNVELGIGVACTGVGKTNLLLNIALGAALHGIQCLFITLELTAKELMQRYLSMAAHVNARHAASTVGGNWEDSELLRYDFMRNSGIKDSVAICELLQRSYTLKDIDAAIDRWKAEARKQYGTDQQCQLVCVDWLDQLSLELSSKQKGDSTDWNVMQRITADLKQVMNRHSVALWTVTQGNRSSVYADKLRMDHTATSFQKMWYVSVALGITAPLEDAYAAEGVDDDNLASESAMDCNRKLTFTIMKNRNGPKFSINLFQGPTLRLWPSAGMWYNTKELLLEANLHKIFGGGTT